MKIIPEVLLGSVSTEVFFKKFNVDPTVVIPIASSSALITFLAILIIIEQISKLKVRIGKFGDWYK